MPKDILVRAVPDKTVKELERLAAVADQSRNDYLVDLLNAHASDTMPAVIRWVDILALPGKPGEADWSAVDCVECGNATDRPHYALMSDGRFLPGARCSVCATSE